MSAGGSCRCAAGRDRSTWQVVQRLGNRSAFNGYRWTPSAWSAVRCTSCSAVWRTKAAYVRQLPDAPDDWWS